jgi:hypothetical protein
MPEVSISLKRNIFGKKNICIDKSENDDLYQYKYNNRCYILILEEYT